MFFDTGSTGEEKLSLLCRLLDEDGYSAHLSNKELFSLAQCLIENGASVNQVEEGSDSPLIQAVRLQSCDLVNFLLTHGANVNHPGKSSRTALHECFGGKHFLFIKSFCKGRIYESVNIIGKNPIKHWTKLYPYELKRGIVCQGEVNIPDVRFVFALNPTSSSPS
jgi:ankyrin repeat protein